MLSLYVKSVIIYLIIYWALNKILKNIMLNREDVNYRDYIKQNKKGAYYIFCFIPILRLFVIGILFFVAFAKKETLDKILNIKN